MKTITIILIWGLVGGCDYPMKPLKKPFVITNKYPQEGGAKFRYYYQDATGNTQAFYDNDDKYNIGDTIK